MGASIHIDPNKGFKTIADLIAGVRDSFITGFLILSFMGGFFGIIFLLKDDDTAHLYGFVLILTSLVMGFIGMMIYQILGRRPGSEQEERLASSTADAVKEHYQKLQDMGKPI